ncbi:MAG: TSUP family transporter [Brevinematia bacterium]
MNWFFYIIVGLGAGLLSGMLGIGGAVLIIPALVLLGGFEQKMAQGTTLFLMVFPIGILAVIEYFKSGYVRVKEGIIIALFFLFGGWLGSKLALSFSSSLLQKIFAIFMLIVAIRMFFNK